VIVPAWRPDEAADLIAAERVNLMMGATVFVADLVARYEQRPAGEHRLTTYAAAGAALAPEVVDRAAAVGVDVVRAYGMTETAGVCAISRPDDPLARRRSWDGRPLAGMHIQATDDHRRPLPPGQPGQLRIRGPQLLTGYTDQRLTAEQLDGQGWFYPGDLGVVDAEGWVRITGRTKDIVNRGGEKFSTLDIELALAAHPGVRAVAVAAVPDARLGEVVGAWLVVDDDLREAGPDRLLAHLRGYGLARQKFPVEWHLVAEIPTTASGKTQKHRLAHLDDLRTWTTRPEGPPR
jgi:acyl-CoA synthetase (AMP-forming)/AMP-acid ligase II